jgi:hypothetical protein
MKKSKQMIAIVLAAMLSGTASADTSPARAQLDKFVVAFNTGDWDSIAAFARDGVPKDMVESGFIRETIEMRKELGELIVVDASETKPYVIEGQVRAKDSGATHTIMLHVSSESPHRIAAIQISPARPTVDRTR